MGETLVRQVGGFADITLNGAKKKQLEDFEAEQKLCQLNQRSYFVHSENASVGWVGSGGKTLDPAPFVTPTLESLSCGARIPTSHLRGANAGTLAGSDTNDREYWGGIAALQELCVFVLWDLIDRLMDTGQIRRVNDYKVVWPSGFELNEKDKAAIMLQEAQARDYRSNWCTVDELRAEEGKLALPEGSGKVVLGLKGSAKPAAPEDPNTDKGEEVPEQDEAEVDLNALAKLAKLFSVFKRKKKEPS